jgi:protein-disulfide isomerase
VDDVVALSVIAVAYTDDLSIAALAVATALFVLILVLRRLGVQRGSPYALLGLGVWLATLESGVHATVAGVALGLLATAYPPSADALGRAGSVWRRFREEPTPGYALTASRTLALAISPNERLQHRFHPWTSIVIVPLFALANAGVQLSSASLRHAAGSPITIGIVLGLVIGKIAGISGVSWLASRPWFGGFPLTISLPHVVGASTVAGIGFTVSLLIASISFQGQALDDAKIGILAASLVATLVAWCAFKVIPRLERRAREAGRAKIEPLIIDLAESVDPEVDHVRGSFEAPVTLVEYGDFECPHCGGVEVAMRELERTFRGDLAFVFRHLPLNDVHPRAQLAAEASEAAADQGSFWEMHDVLFQHQDALTLADLRTYAADLGLDVERFTREIQDRRHALRVARDLESADDSGAAGTPTFFINGRRHQGPLDFDSLSSALRSARDAM